MIRPVILTLALAAGAGAAWGQTASCLDPGTVCFDANNGARYVGGHMTDPPPIHPAHAYTPADLDRFGKVQGGGAPPTLTISDECKAIPQFSGASACICPDGHMIDVGQHCSDTSRPTRTYTPADLDRLRKVEWRLLGTDAMTPWQAKLLIEARVQTDVAAGVSVEELERGAGK